MGVCAIGVAAGVCAGVTFEEQQLLEGPAVAPLLWIRGDELDVVEGVAAGLSISTILSFGPPQQLFLGAAGPDMARPFVVGDAPLVGAGIVR